MALGFGDVPLEIVIRASNQLAPGLAAAGAQLKAFQREVAASGGQMNLPGIGGGGGGLAGAVGPTLGILGGVALFSGLVAAGKSVLDTYRAQQTALSDLKQAYESVNLPADENLKLVQGYIDKNQPYISNINAVREGFAAVTRAGIDQRFIAKTVDDALNLSILKHQDFSETLHTVLLGLEGNARGLKDLGINTKNYGDLTRSTTQIAADDAAAKKKVDEATVNLAKAQRALAEDLQRLHDKGYTTASDLMHEQDLKGKVQDATGKLKDAQQTYVDTVKKGNDQVREQGQLLNDIAGKAAGGKGTLDDLSKAQNDLNASWEKFSTKIGPGLRYAMADITMGFRDFIEALGGGLDMIGKLVSAPGPTGGHWQHNYHAPDTWVPGPTSYTGTGGGRAPAPHGQ